MTFFSVDGLCKWDEDGILRSLKQRHSKNERIRIICQTIGYIMCEKFIS